MPPVKTGITPTVMPLELTSVRPCATGLLLVRLTASWPAVTDRALGANTNAPLGSAAVATVREPEAAPDCIVVDVLGGI